MKGKENCPVLSLGLAQKGTDMMLDCHYPRARLQGPLGKQTRQCQPHLKDCMPPAHSPTPRRTPHAAPHSAAGALGSTVSHLGLKSLSQLMEHQRASQLLTVCFLPGTRIN